MVKVNDRVSHVYNMKLVGTVIQLVEGQAHEHFEGGTSARKFYAVVKLDGAEQTFTANINDLMREQ
jgi:hypothetical protein